jgi:hypothetical protein
MRTFTVIDSLCRPVKVRVSLPTRSALVGIWLRLRNSFAYYAYRRELFERVDPAANRVFMTYATPPLSIASKRGIEKAKTYNDYCRN